ncbi:hypothetical protein [Streptomyces uncialis]|uniref:hypothetical protein n=1 Tax=Streptomyces uncialis TaxID=1048205 RepID=UPI0033CFAD07
MEQPIGKNPPLVDAAAIDPAHVPGLATPIALTEPGAVGRPDGGGRKEPEEPRDGSPAVPGDMTDDDTPDDVPDVVPEDTDDTDGPERSGTAEVPDGPVFEVSDRRGSILVDGTGVSFTLDDQAAEWTWDEIGAVEYTTTRFSRRLTVYVHTPDRRWYPNEIQAPARGDLTEWTERLDAALDAWFEDEEPADGKADGGKDGSAGATAVAVVKAVDRAGGGKAVGGKPGSGKPGGGKPGGGSGSGSGSGGGDSGSSGS